MAEEDVEDLGSPGVTQWRRIFKTSRWHGQIMKRLLMTGHCGQTVVQCVSRTPGRT